MRTTLLITYVLLSNCLFSEDQNLGNLTENNKNELAAIYRAEVDLHEDSPDDLNIDVIFVDLNQDGKIDALAASHTSKYQDGWHWMAFLRTEEGGWEATPQADEPTDDTEVFARPSEFYQLKGENSPEHVFILKNSRTEGSDGSEPSKLQSAVRIKFDENGVLVLEEIEVPDEEQLADYEKLTSEIIGE